MIVFGYTLQDLPRQLPAEVALWVLERDSLYPEVDFRIQYSIVHDDERELNEEMRNKFAYTIQCRGGGVPMGVTFRYPDSTWHVQIIGDLSGSERVKIGIGSEKVTEVENPYGGNPYLGVQFSDGSKAPLETEMLPVEPHIFEEGFQITGAELLDVVSNSQTERNAALLQAMTEKNWEEAKRLLKQRH